MEKQNKMLEIKKESIQQQDESQKGETKLLEKERLLTEQERKHIIEIFEQRDWKTFVIACVLFYVVVIGLSLFFFELGGIKDAIINFFLWTLFIVVYIGELFFLTEKHLRLVRENRVYVKEAIFLYINNYHYGNFVIMKKGKKEYFFCKAGLRENVKKGDVVILVPIRKKYVWVYKARKDEVSSE